MLMSQITETENKNLTQKNLYKASATSSLLAFVLFLIGITSIIATLLQITINDGWFMQLQDNWLILLFKMNMGFQANLNVINLIDITIMALFCAMFLGLYTALKKKEQNLVANRYSSALLRHTLLPRNSHCWAQHTINRSLDNLYRHAT
jgi:hypothetical protein